SVANGQGAALAGARLDLDLETQDVAEVLLERSGVGILVGAAPAASGTAIPAFADGLHQSLDRPHVQILGHDALRQRFGVVTTDRGWSGPRRQRALGDSDLTAAGSLSKRKVLAIWLRLLPMTSANCSCV